MKTCTPLALLLLWLIASPAPACVYYVPPDLWTEVESAEVIVVVEVEAFRENPMATIVSRIHEVADSITEYAGDVEPGLDVLAEGFLDPLTPDPPPQLLAQLRVVETLKGEAAGVLKVPFDNRRNSPPFYLGERTVVLLERGFGRWKSSGAVRGFLPLNEDEVEDLSTVVRAAMELQEAPEVEFEKRREWTVLAITLPGSRSFGLWQRHLLGSQQEPPAETPFILTPHEQHLLAETWLRDDQIDTDFLAVLDLLTSYPSKAVDRRSAALVEAMLLEETSTSMLRWILVATLRRFDDPDPEGRLARLVNSRDHFHVLARSIWGEARVDLGIPLGDVESARFQIRRNQELVEETMKTWREDMNRLR